MVLRDGHLTTLYATCIRNIILGHLEGNNARVVQGKAEKKMTKMLLAFHSGKLFPYKKTYF